jgi:hypothetical protein
MAALSRKSAQKRRSFQILDRQVGRKPCIAGGAKGHNIKEISFPGSPAVCARGFTSCSLDHFSFSAKYILLQLLVSPQSTMDVNLLWIVVLQVLREAPPSTLPKE